ncbi:MAG: hypothetical protein AB7E60_13560 [Sphingobium sp.]
MSTSLPPFVSGVAPGMWVLKGAKPFADQLTSLGLTLSGDGEQITASHSYSDDLAMARVATELCALGFYFSDGRDWSPKAFLHHLRDAGLFIGAVPEIYWTKSGKAHTREDS